MISVSRCFSLKIAIPLFFLLASIPLCLKANYLQPNELNLVNPPLDSIQKTIWKEYPVLIHRRTEEQMKKLQKLFDETPSYEKRISAYRSIARMKGHEFASNIMEFTEKYISEKNVYMSEIPEIGVFSMVSPILGCSISRDGNGFVDPCNGIRFDIVGKVIDHIGYDHLRLTIPPHRIVNNKLVFLENYKAKKIIDFTPDILAMNDSDLSKAILAIDYERPDILKLIVEKSPEIITQQNNVGSTLLQVASYHQKTLDYLLSFDEVQINHINDSGYTALLFSISLKNFDNAEKLVHHGARFDSFSLNGVSAKSVEEFTTEYLNFDKQTVEKLLKRLKKAEEKFNTNAS
jgi:hypothetical protein